MRQAWRRFAAPRRGDHIYVMALEDLDGQIEVVIVGDVYRHYKAALSTAGPYVIEGTVELDVTQGEPLIRAERVWGVG
jgi:DNA polymerase III alpha subunit